MEFPALLNVNCMEHSSHDNQASCLKILELDRSTEWTTVRIKYQNWL